MEWREGSWDEDDEGVCLCCPGAAPCCLIAPSPWTQMKPLSHQHPWCPFHLLPQCPSPGCRNQVGGLGQSWTMGEGCDWSRAEVAGEEGLSGRSDLGEEEIIKVEDM